MEETRDVKELSKIYLEKAEEKLNSSKYLLKEKYIDDSISRAYYAAFFAVKALLLLLGFDAKTHSGLITLFNLHVIKEGLLPKEIGKKMKSLFDARQSSDYEPISLYDVDDAKELIDFAETIVKAIKAFVKEKFGVIT